MPSRIRSRHLRAATLASATALVLAACGGAASGDASDDATTDNADGAAAEGRPLVVWAGSETPITANFNPFAPTVLHGALGPIYETLFHYNKAAATEPDPLLGETYEFSEDGETLTVQLRDGVVWSDGEAFTADDVVYTFTHELTSPEYIDDVTAADEHTVVFDFDGPQFTNEFSVLGSQRIIAEHVWSQVDDPMTDPHVEPVGTGPYLVDSYSESSYTLVANPEFRDGEVAVKEVKYVAIDGNQSAEDLLRTGQVDWAGMFVPDPESLTGDGRLGYLNTPQDPTVMYTCANADLGCEGEQTDVAVRQALNVAIDRETINDRAFVGHSAPSSPVYLLQDRDEEWLADGMPAESPLSADAEAAGQILEEAGYEKDSDGFYGKDGERIELTITSVDDWTDYNNAALLIEEQAEAAGIKVTAGTVSWNEFSDSRQTGSFELILGGVVGASIADPYSVYDDWFTGASTTPVGEELKPGTWNFSRYDNEAVNEAVDAAGRTNDPAEKLEQYAIIQEHIVEDMPYVPVVVNATQTFFDTTDFTGWPTEDDMYAFPPSWGATSAGVILANLQPVG